MGVYFFTCFLETLHTSRGHLEHLVLVVYPDVSSSHFSSTSVLTTSSTNQRQVLYCVNQSEASIVLCHQPKARITCTRQHHPQ